MQQKYIQKLIDIRGRANLSRNSLFKHIFIDLEPFENSAAALRGLWQRSHYSWIMRPQCCLVQCRTRYIYNAAPYKSCTQLGMPSHKNSASVLSVTLVMVQQWQGWMSLILLLLFLFILFHPFFHFLLSFLFLSRTLVLILGFHFPPDLTFSRPLLPSPTSGQIAIQCYNQGCIAGHNSLRKPPFLVGCSCNVLQLSADFWNFQIRFWLLVIFYEIASPHNSSDYVCYES